MSHKRVRPENGVFKPLFSENIKKRLILGWVIGFAASALGMALSYHLDFPTGASVVCTFGAILVVLAVVKGLMIESRGE